MHISKSDSIDAILGSPLDDEFADLVYILGVDVWDGTIGSNGVVKTNDDIGFHMATLLTSCIICMHSLYCYNTIT